MNWRHGFLLKSGATILLLCASRVRANAQANPAKQGGEQTSFSVESDFQHPVPLDEAAKEALATSPTLADDLKRKHIEPKDLPHSWFTASKVHLGDGEVGLVVMGVDGLLGANTAPFWVLRKTAEGYNLALDTIGSQLEVLKTKTNGAFDIKASALTGVAYWGSLGYEFDGRAYQLARRESGTIGAKIPTDLSGYETHAPFVEPPDDATSPVLAEARTWIWEHWKAHKRFYATVSAKDDPGNGETYQVYTSDDSDYPGLILKVHKTDLEHNSTSGPPRKITEDDLWNAPDLERVYPADDKDHEPQMIPDESNVPGSAYRLGFRQGEFWLALM